MTLELSTTTIGGAPTPHQRRLSDKALDLIGSHLSPNTRRAYTSDLAQVFAWLVATDRARPIDLELDKAQELAAYSTLTAIHRRPGRNSQTLNHCSTGGRPRQTPRQCYRHEWQIKWPTYS